MDSQAHDNNVARTVVIRFQIFTLKILTEFNIFNQRLLLNLTH